MNDMNEQRSSEIAALYQSGISSTELSRRFKISVPTVFRCLRKHGVKSRPVSEARRRYNLNHDYFKMIDSHDKAQMLGMIGADGNVATRREVFEITLQEDDGYYLDRMKNLMGYEGPLLKTYCKRFDTHYVRLAVYSKVFKDHLINLGITPKKSLTMTFPSLDQIPDQFLSSYILGYYEGDGGIQVWNGKDGLVANVKICVTKEFGERLKEILKEKADVNGTLFLRKEYSQDYTNMYSLGISGTNQVKRFCEWIYSDAPFVMTRKHDKYLYLLSHFDADGNRVKQENWSELARQKCATTHVKNGTQPGRAPKIDAYFISPENIVYHVSRVSLFAREMRLCKSLLYYMLKGEKTDDYKGWRVATKEDIDRAANDGSIVEKTYTFGEV